MLRWSAKVVMRGNHGTLPRDDQNQRWLFIKLRIAMTCLLLSLRNRISRNPLTSATGSMVVSLTTYGPRIPTVFLTLESIGLSTVQPKSVVLWVAEDDYATAIQNAALRRLARRGVEIRMCEDYGPHKKYLPWVLETPDEGLQSGLVTADDDVLYPSRWLEGFSSTVPTLKDSVLCYRGCDVGGGRLMNDPYASWPLAGKNCTGLDLFPTGVSGVFYPPAVLRECKLQGTAFRSLCPQADDIWLYALRLRTKSGALIVGQRGAREWWPVPRAHRTGLFRTNVAGGGNDAALQRTLKLLSAPDG